LIVARNAKHRCRQNNDRKTKEAFYPIPASCNDPIVSLSLSLSRKDRIQRSPSGIFPRSSVQLLPLSPLSSPLLTADARSADSRQQRETASVADGFAFDNALLLERPIHLEAYRCLSLAFFPRFKVLSRMLRPSSRRDIEFLCRRNSPSRVAFVQRMSR